VQWRQKGVHCRLLPARSDPEPDLQLAPRGWVGVAIAQQRRWLHHASRPEDHSPVPSFDVLLLGIGPIRGPGALN
jgi:6-phosphogluconolactonase